MRGQIEESNAKSQVDTEQNAKLEAAERLSLCVQHSYSAPVLDNGKTVFGHDITSRIYLQGEKHPDDSNWVASRAVHAFNETPPPVFGGMPDRPSTWFALKMTNGKLDPAAKGPYYTDYVSENTGKDDAQFSDASHYPGGHPLNRKQFNEFMVKLHSLDFDHLPKCQIQE